MKMKEMLSSSSSSSSSSSKVRMEEEEGEDGESQTTSGERLGLIKRSNGSNMLNLDGIMIDVSVF